MLVAGAADHSHEIVTSFPAPCSGECCPATNPKGFPLSICSALDDRTVDGVCTSRRKGWNPVRPQRLCRDRTVLLEVLVVTEVRLVPEARVEVPFAMGVSRTSIGGGISPCDSIIKSSIFALSKCDTLAPLPAVAEG